MTRPTARTGGEPAPSRGRGTAIGLALLLVAEVAWFAWILETPLPNVANAGGRQWRAVFLWRALPEVVPGVSWSESFLGQAAAHLGHPANLDDRVPIVLAAVLIAAAAVALGGAVLRLLRTSPHFTRLERVALAYGLGASVLGALTLVAGRVVGLAPWPVRVGLGLAVAGGAVGSWRRGDRRADRPGHGWRSVLGRAAIVGPFLVLMALGAMQPTIEFDALEYHLQGPKEHFQAWRIAFLPHNVYTSMPAGVEMLHLLGMEVLGDWWTGALAGQLLVMLFAPATAVMVAGAARRLGSERAGWLAALVYLTTPWVYRLGVLPFVEGPLCFYHAALVATVVAWRGWSAQRTPQDAGPRPGQGNARSTGTAGASWGVLLGLLAGGAMACKYPALVSAVVPFGAAVGAGAIRDRRARTGMRAERGREAWEWCSQSTLQETIGFVAGVALIVGPWLARNVVDTGNPVYPLAYGVFGGSGWSAEQDARWKAAHGPRTVTWDALRTGLLDVAGRSDWQSPLFLALAPLAVLRPGSRRAVGWLWAYVGYLFGTWFLLTHRLDRFWIPLLPALAVLAGLGADWSRARAWRIALGGLLAVGIAANAVFVTTDLAGPNRWTDPLALLRVEVPAELNPPLARLDAELPREARVLLVGQASVFHLDRPIVYSTVFNEEPLEALARGRTPEQLREALRKRGITHVYVDWSEIERYRRPGNYGFTDYVTPERLARLVEGGVLGPPEPIGTAHELYPVR